MLHRFFLSGLLAALPLAGFAQAQTPAAPKPQFFVGLGASIGSYLLPNSFGVNVISPAPTVGVQLRPRLAVQASGAYYQESYSYSYAGQLFINGRLQPGINASSNRRRTVAVPVLARYTLARRPGRRLQADLLGGFAVVHSAYRSTGTTTDSTLTVVSAHEYNSAATGFHFVLGPSLRCRLGQHLDLTGDFVFNTLLNNRSDYSNRLSATAALGLRYRFSRG